MQIKYCPSCGKSSLSQRNDKQWHCAHCGFEYFHNVAAAVAGIIVCHDEILLAQRKIDPAKGRLDLPGGFVDYGESLEQAIARECKEELGIENLTWQYFCSFPNEYKYVDVLYHTQDAFFIAELQEKPHIIPQDDVADAVWRNLKEIHPQEMAFKSVQQALHLWLQTRL